MAPDRSPTTVTEEMTRKVAELARLELSENEVKTFSRQLGDVLGYVEQLKELEIDPALEPMTQPFELKAPLREDDVVPSPVDDDGNPKVLASAPEALEGGFKVPPIL